MGRTLNMFLFSARAGYMSLVQSVLSSSVVYQAFHSVCTGGYFLWRRATRVWSWLHTSI